MGFTLDIKVEKEYIDHGYDGKPYYHEEVHMSGNGCSDILCIQQEDQIVGMSVWQFKNLMRQLRKTSFWYYADLDKLGED